MTPEQEDIIREKTTFSSWGRPMNKDIWVSTALFSLKFLLPDENISAYIHECPVWPYWTYFIDDGPGEKSWYFVQHKKKDLSPLDPFVYHRHCERKTLCPCFCRNFCTHLTKMVD